MNKKKFLEVVEGFLSKHSLAAATFGAQALNSPDFVLRLRRGRECREDTQRRVFDFMNNYGKVRPEDFYLTDSDLEKEEKENG